jgi:hypothetical protein
MLHRRAPDEEWRKYFAAHQAAGAETSYRRRPAYPGSVDLLGCFSLLRRVAPTLTALAFVFAINAAPKPTTAVFNWAVQQRAASITHKVERVLLPAVQPATAQRSTQSPERHRPR